MNLVVNLVMSTLRSKRLDAKRHYVILAKALDGTKDLGAKILPTRYQDLGTKIFGGTSLVRWRDPPGGEGSLRDCPREDKR